MHNYDQDFAIINTVIPVYMCYIFHEGSLHNGTVACLISVRHSTQATHPIRIQNRLFHYCNAPFMNDRVTVDGRIA